MDCQDMGLKIIVPLGALEVSGLFGGLLLGGEGLRIRVRIGGRIRGREDD